MQLKIYVGTAEVLIKLFFHIFSRIFLVNKKMQLIIDNHMYTNI